MKRRITTFLSTILILSLFIVACGEENKIHVPSNNDKKEDIKKEDEKDKEKQNIDLSNQEWQEDEQVLKPFGGKISIDKSNSTLPEGVYVSEDNKTISLPYGYNDFSIKLQSDDELEYIDSSNNIVKLVQKTEISSEMNEFTVKRAYLAPSQAERTEVLRFKRKGLNEAYSEDSIRVVIAPNANLVSGMLVFDNVTRAHNFNEYVENELGVFELAEGKKIEAKFDNDEDSWIIIQPFADNNRKHKVIAGWRPNDPKADGREQSARIVISNNDDTQKEEYTIVRKNYGMPVVRIGNTWWCKYNLRGNVKSFSDQILTTNDPARGVELAQHLIGCDENELLKIMGDQYRAPNQEGMKLMIDSNKKYYHTNFSGNTTDFGNTPQTEMAPTGYMIPTSGMFRNLMSSNQMIINTLSGEYGNSQTGSNAATIIYNIHKRNVSFLGGTYGDVRFYEFKIKGEENSIVLFGLGHQWTASHGNVAPRSILFASYGQTRKAWQFDCNNTENETNKIYNADNNTTKTRTIRCVKAPVEYIY